MSATVTTPADLDRFREVQQLAYRCATEVAASLRPGITERQAARRMRWWLQANGVEDWFHLPYAWFGDRTAFRDFRVSLQFFPTNRVLLEGMPFILDCAPVVDGFTADIGYAASCGSNPVLDSLLDDLEPIRELIVRLVRARRPLREVYAAVDALIASQGNENRHRIYPGAVIGHQVFRVTSRLPRLRLARFGVRSLAHLERELIAGRLAGRSPLWNGRRASDHPPTPGLWAVEPHLGQGAVGAKFEELLVVTEDDAYWLDDDLPHVRRWKRAATETATAA